MGKKNNGQKKGNVYEADRSMSYRVEDFVRVQMFELHWKERMKRDLKKIEQKIEAAPELLKGSVFADNLDELIEGYKAEAEAIRKSYKERMAEAEKFRFTVQDNNLYDAYLKNDQAELEKAMVDWFKAYKWDTTGTQWLTDCIDATRGLVRAKNRTIIESVVYDSKGDARATKFTQQRSKRDFLMTLYCYIAERMVDLKMIQAPWVAPDVVAIYKK